MREGRALPGGAGRPGSTAFRIWRGGGGARVSHEGEDIIVLEVMFGRSAGDHCCSLCPRDCSWVETVSIVNVGDCLTKCTGRYAARPAGGTPGCRSPRSWR